MSIGHIRYIQLMLTLGFCLCSQLLLAQQYRLLVSDQHQALLLREGLDCKFRFKGYQGQNQEFRGKIIAIDSLTLTLVKKSKQYEDTLKIAIADISGCKPYSIGYKLAKSGTEALLIGGSIVFYVAVLSAAPLLPVIRFTLGLGVSAVNVVIVKVLFPDTIKYETINGYRYQAYQTL